MITYAQFGPKTPNWNNALLISIAGDCYIPAFEGHPWFEVGMWSVEKVVADIEKELSQTGALGFLALENGKVVGCIWGYPMKQNKLFEKIGLKVPYDGIAMYLDDIYVAPDYHGQKVASTLYKLWIKKVGGKVVLARTMTKPPTVVYPWFLKMGYEVMAEYGDDIGRVILKKDLSRLPNWMRF